MESSNSLNNINDDNEILIREFILNKLEDKFILNKFPSEKMIDELLREKYKHFMNLCCDYTQLYYSINNKYDFSNKQKENKVLDNYIIKHTNDINIR